jgi:hypothetical protein
LGRRRENRLRKAVAYTSLAGNINDMLMLGASEGVYANAALFIAIARKLIAKEIN